MNNFLSLLLIIALLSSCNKFDEINTNPDATTKVTSSLLATGLLLNITSSSSGKSFVNSALLSKQLAWGGEGMEDYQYNIFGRSSFGGYNTLINAQKMVESVSDDNVNAYDGLAHFIKAYKLFYMSLEMGDIPYEEALLGEKGLVKPRYNTQKEVINFILEDLAKAYELFSNGKDFTGDPILGGKIELWKKATTAFQLKVLMHLSKKENDSDLNIKQRFSEIATSGNLMESNTDNLQMIYMDKANTLYPFNKTNHKYTDNPILTNIIIDILKKTGDIRMFYYAKPSEAKLKSGLQADDWSAYIGIDPSAPFEEINKAYAALEYSGLNPRYTDYPAGEPVIRLGYAEQNFILAEAIVRGWIQGDASIYYKKGVEASMNFIADNTPNDVIYHHGHPITEESIAAFLETSAIQLTGNKEHDIEKIITQRYLASFMQHPWDTYYDYRRTGYPVFPINPETNRNDVKDQLPMRWMYPQSESDYNKENIDEALQRQFNGVDDVNKLMWILQ